MKTHLKTPLGISEISGSELGISSIKILEESESAEISKTPPDFLKPAVEQLQAYFSGEIKDFNLKLQPQGTEFQQKVWRELQNIPFGRTMSYLDLAKKLGDAKAIRAVAAANGKNPLWIVVPCHRVIGSKGELTGYAGGLHRKKWLLEHEGAIKQISLF